MGGWMDGWMGGWVGGWMALGPLRPLSSLGRLVNTEKALTSRELPETRPTDGLRDGWVGRWVGGWMDGLGAALSAQQLGPVGQHGKGLDQPGVA